MDFDFTDEQLMLKETVYRYLKEKIAPIASEYDRKGPMSKADAHAFLKNLQPFGYLGTVVDEKYGGMGLSYIDWAILNEGLRGAYASLGGIVGITNSAAKAISDSGNEAIKERVLPGLLSGDKIACTAITEPNVGSDAGSIETKAVWDGDEYVLNGTKMWISNGTIADYVTVLASVDPSKGSRGLMQILVEKEVSPFEAREIKKVGVKSFPTAELIFDDCRVPKDNVIAEPGQGLKRSLTRLTAARCNAAISSVGVAQAAIDAAVAYSKERNQFGRPIAGFQLIQGMIAEMIAAVDAARLLTYRAYALLDKGKRCVKESAMAKFFATETGVWVTSKAIQVLGAYGLSEEFPLERYFRDARCYTIPDGTSEIQKLIVGREVLGISAIR